MLSTRSAVAECSRNSPLADVLRCESNIEPAAIDWRSLYKSEHSGLLGARQNPGSGETTAERKNNGEQRCGCSEGKRPRRYMAGWAMATGTFETWIAASPHGSVGKHCP